MTKVEWNILPESNIPPDPTEPALVRLPLARGLLTGKFSLSTQFSASDHRNYNRDGQIFNVGETFAGLPFRQGVKLAEQLRAFVPAGLTMAEMALRWCLDFDAVSAIIPGAKHSEQARASPCQCTSTEYRPTLQRASIRFVGFLPA